jgi:predicted RNA-binding protein with RPS1 domain
MSAQTFDDFNWDIYEDNYSGDTKLTPNKSINGNSKKNKCFSREPYAQKLFDIYTEQNTDLIKKDLNKGDIVPIIDLFNIKDNFIDVELAGGITVTIDLLREKKFIQVFGYNTPKEFTDILRDKNNVSEMLKKGMNAYIIEAIPSVKISLWQGHLKSVRDEFMQQIENPTKAYTAKIMQANKGGFFVVVQGIEAFMPGSLAAPNKIIDFQSYIGKDVVVMIEDFLKEMNSFIVSHKKYLTHIIPIKIQELDLSKKYSGLVTGCSKYGIFVEFDELFTGLLHTSKMDNETKTTFNQRLIKSGDLIEFYIAEITKDNRIILTKESPEDKLNKIQSFILNSKDKILESSVAAVMNFGIIVNMHDTIYKNDISGLIPIFEFKRNKIMMNNYMVGEKINVVFDQVKDEKLIFKLALNEKKT